MMHHFKKRLGQNFLQDPQVIEQIVGVISPQVADHLIEIGPGQGALTEYLVDRCKHYSAIELDQELMTPLNLRFSSHPHFQLHAADALTFNYHTLTPKPLRLIGNLPYNISAPLLLHWMQYCPDIQDIHVMVQKEMAERIIAVPGNKDYGRLSVVLQYHCQAYGLLMVNPEAFYPIPKVHSMVIRLIPYPQKPQVAQDLEQFYQLVKQAFGQRRKTIANTLKPYFTKPQLQHLGIDPEQRPETLAVGDYVRLANSL